MPMAAMDMPWTCHGNAPDSSRDARGGLPDNCSSHVSRFEPKILTKIRSFFLSFFLKKEKDGVMPWYYTWHGQ